MRSVVAIFVVGLVAWVCGQVPKKEGPEPAWAEDWDGALDEARQRGVPLFVVIPRHRGTFGGIVYPKQLKDKTILQLCEGFVCMIADEKRFEDVAKHIAVEYHKGKYGVYGQKLQFIFCRPSGEELEEFHLVGDVSVSELAETMRKVLRLYPKGIPRSRFFKCRALRDRAKRLLKELLFRAAKKTLEKLVKTKQEMEMVKWAQDTLKELPKTAQEELQKIKKMLESEDAADRREAVSRLVALKVGTEGDREFKKVNMAAKELLVKLRSDPVVSAQAKESTKIERALRIFLKAEDLFYEGKLKKAYKEFRKVMKMYPDTDYAERAKERARQIREMLEEQEKK